MRWQGHVSVPGVSPERERRLTAYLPASVAQRRDLAGYRSQVSRQTPPVDSQGWDRDGHVRSQMPMAKRHPDSKITAVLIASATLVAAVVVMSFMSLALSAPVRASGQRVAVYLTTRDLKSTLARQPDLTFRAGTTSGAESVSVDPSVDYQTLTAGFGVAMTDTSAYELDTQLPAALRDEVMQKLFSPTGGIGLSFLRVPIGGSDYVVGNPYTYDDMPAGQVDPTLSHFSLAHDQPYIIPMIRQALAVNPAISVMANPWTPPAWMKTDDQLVTTTGPLGTLLPQYYGAYANYLVKFLQGYQAAGIKVDFLGVQNEPLTPLLFVAGIPESYLSPTDEGTLIHSYVAPALRQARLGQKVLAYDDGYVRDQAYVPAVIAQLAATWPDSPTTATSPTPPA